MADNSPLDEALAMVGDTVGPDTPQNVRQEKPRLPPQITAGMCRFFKDLKSHENPGVKIRIEYKEKDALKAICADIGVDYFYPKKNSTYEWLVYPLISLRHAIRVVDVLKGELSSLMDVNLGNAQYFDSLPQAKIGVIRSDKKRDEDGELLGESYLIVGKYTKCIKGFLKQDWPGIQWKKFGEDDDATQQAWVLPADRTNDAEITEYFASIYGFRVVFAVDNFAN